MIQQTGNYSIHPYEYKEYANKSDVKNIAVTFGTKPTNIYFTKSRKLRCTSN